MREIIICALLLAGWHCPADSPSIKYLGPSAVAPARTTEVTFFGSDFGGVTGLWMTFDGTAEKLKCAEDRAVFNISLPSPGTTGFGAVRLVSTNGISSVQLVMIDGLPNLRASGTNHSIASAQELKLPVAVEGECEEKTSEFFKFTARKGERRSFEVVAQRLGSALDPLLRLFDAQGRELIFCEDTPGAGVDCRFEYKFASSGQYLLELRDTRYEGGRQHRYRLRMGDFSSEPLPLPFRAKAQFRAAGSSLPPVTEVEPNDSQPQTISLPASIHGRFARAKDRDWFQFEPRKGERLVFRGRTRSLGSPCDLYLRLETVDGKKLAESPMSGADEGLITSTFKEAGSYRLLVEEAAQCGGPEYFYLLDIEPSQAGFALNVDTAKVQGPKGGTVELKITPERHDYDGPITLALRGAPEGFSLEPNIITSKTNSTTVKLTLPTTLEAGQLVNFKIIGHAKIDTRDIAATVSTRPALRKLFPHLPWPPMDLDGWIALGVTTK